MEWIFSFNEETFWNQSLNKTIRIKVSFGTVLPEHKALSSKYSLVPTGVTLSFGG